MSFIRKFGKKLKLNKFVLNILRVFISVGILALILYKLELSFFYSLITSKNFLLVLILLSLHFILTFVINTLNIKVILDALNIQINYFSIMRSNLVAYAMGQFLPGRVGDFLIVLLLKKKGVNYGIGSSSFIVDKIITLISLVLVSCLGILLFVLLGLFTPTMAFGMILIMVLFTITVILFICSERVRYLIKKFILRKYSKNFKGFYNNIIYLIKNKKRYLLLNFFLTLLRLFASAYMIYLVFYNVYNIKLNYLFVPIINAIGLLMTLIPVSLSGLGITEGSAVYLFSMIGINITIVATVYLTLRFLYYLYSGIILLIYLNLSKKE